MNALSVSFEIEVWIFSESFTNSTTGINNTYLNLIHRWPMLRTDQNFIGTAVLKNVSQNFSYRKCQCVMERSATCQCKN